jgi:hypothetical protein
VRKACASHQHLLLFIGVVHKYLTERKKVKTQTTKKFITTKAFTLHLYDDITEPPTIYIRLNDVEIKMQITKTELENINQKINEAK